MSYAEKNNEIPSWVKLIAGAWSNDEITDSEFTGAMKFLIENEMIVIDGYGKIDIPIEEPKDMELTVSTDKISYVRGDDIIISGTIPQSKGGELLIMVRYADMAFIEMYNVSAQDGQYKKIISTTDRDDFETKEFTIEVRYNSEKIFTNFQYSR